MYVYVPSIEPCKTSSSTTAHEEYCPFRTTLFRWYKKSFTVFWNLPDMLFSISLWVINWKNYTDVIIYPHFFRIVLFLLSSLVTCPIFMSISLLILELWQYSFERGWLEISKLEIAPSEFSQIFGDWRELGIKIWHKCL